MPIVLSDGRVRALMDPQPTFNAPGGAWVSYWQQASSYRVLYATQPNVRVCVDFLARNVAHLGLHVFRRVSDTDRVRLVDHELARSVQQANRSTVRYRLFEDLMSDLGIYFSAYWLKARYADGQGRPTIGLLRIPPEEMQVEGLLLPTAYRWLHNGQTRLYDPIDVVAFRGFNPLNSLIGLSPLETLKGILFEEAAASTNRAQYWLNASRHEGIIEQTKEAPNYTPPQLLEFRAQWQEFAGNGLKAGQTPLLPKGMSYKSTSFSARDSEYMLGRKLTREECAAAYHIPQPFVGILDHATFSNIKEQHKNLYQDTLGPWLEWIQEEIEAQLLPECDDTRDVYVEFNIAEKLKGSFEEQANALQVLVGRPIMTANEGRARLNLPSLDSEDADTLAPQQGGPAQQLPQPPVDDTVVAVEAVPIVEAAWKRQARKIALLPAGERAAGFDHPRWTRELAADLLPVLGPDRAIATATRVNDDTYRRLLEGADDAFEGRTPALGEGRS